MSKYTPSLPSPSGRSRRRWGTLAATTALAASGLAASTAALRAGRPDVLIAIDEEGGDVTRLAHATGSPYPGNAALGAIDEVALTRRVYEAIGAELAGLGVTVNLADSTLGKILADGSGKTLYVFTPDAAAAGKSVCNGDCAASWPPLTSDAAPTLGAGLDAESIHQRGRQGTQHERLAGGRGEEESTARDDHDQQQDENDHRPDHRADQLPGVQAS